MAIKSIGQYWSTKIIRPWSSWRLMVLLHPFPARFRRVIPVCFLLSMPNLLSSTLFNLVCPISLTVNSILILKSFTGTASRCQSAKLSNKRREECTRVTPVAPQSWRCRADAAAAALRKRGYDSTTAQWYRKSISNGLSKVYLHFSILFCKEQKNGGSSCSPWLW